MIASVEIRPASLLTLAIVLTILLGLLPLGSYAIVFGNEPKIHSTAAWKSQCNKTGGRIGGKGMQTHYRKGQTLVHVQN